MEDSLATTLSFFQFQLFPWEGCLNVAPREIVFPQHFRGFCTRDRLTLFLSHPHADRDNAKEWALLLAESFVSAHAFLGYPKHPALDLKPLGGLEVQDIPGQHLVRGTYRDDSLEQVPLDSNHLDNVPFQEAAALLREFSENEYLLFALYSFRIARREKTQYFAFHAFRALESVGYSFGVNKKDQPDWEAMNRALGTQKANWLELTKAGEASRHLNRPSSQKLATYDREKLLTTAHDGLKRWIEHLKSLPIS
jgi:hypothetical protein